MKFLSSLIVLALTLALAGSAFAADKEGASKKQGAAKKEGATKPSKKRALLIGVVIGVDGSALKIKPKGNGSSEAVVTTDADTVVEIDGKAAKLADLAAGDRVRILPSTGVAQKIVAKSAAKGKADKVEKEETPAKTAKESK